MPARGFGGRGALSAPVPLGEATGMLAQTAERARSYRHGPEIAVPRFYVTWRLGSGALSGRW
jgi:hypothetical protein